MKRKGELSSTALVTIILAIVGFLLVGLALYNIFKDDSLTNRDLCRLSVLSRATVPSAGQQFVPLNCQTEKICLTVKGDNNDCKQFAGEKNVRNVELKVDGSLNDAKAVDTIQREVANAMYDCWLMTGQGKLDIFPPGDSASSPATKFLEQIADGVDLTSLEVKPSCIVCSRLAFSDALYEANTKYNHFLRDIDFNNYLSTQTVGNTGKTYTSIFTGGSATGYSSISQKENSVSIPGIKAPTVSNQLSIIFAQIKVSDVDPKDKFWNTLTNGAILGSIGIATSPGSVANVPLGLFKVATVGAVSTYLAFDAESTAKENQALSAATCGDFSSTIDGQKGCSLVKLMNWNVNDVNALCNNIEGNL
ncbi:MAG: hypothetical protein ACP5N7_04735 [Candidatus Pacearchaeota archaeon]